MEDPIKEAEEVEEKKIAELKNRMTKSKKEKHLPWLTSHTLTEIINCHVKNLISFSSCEMFKTRKRLL